jgi:hypothetical protein
MTTTRVLAVLLAAMISTSAGAVGISLPIFDAHMHFSAGSRDSVSTQEVLDRMSAAGVSMAAVSSSPDDGTLALHAADPKRIVPVLRPYHGDITSGNWFSDASTPGYLQQRLALGGHKGIGEAHLFDPASAATPVMIQVLDMVEQRGLVIHLHTGAEVIGAILAKRPKLRLLWAHAGMSDPPEAIGPLLDKYTGLSVELSFRAHDIGRGDALDPKWEALLTRHSDRFVIGTDTYVVDRWAEYEELVAEHRASLRLLPMEIAKRIAHENAEKLFGVER